MLFEEAIKQSGIISSGFMTRGQVCLYICMHVEDLNFFDIQLCDTIIQIDLIDMTHHPDGPYHWIGHFMDHALVQVACPLSTDAQECCGSDS